MHRLREAALDLLGRTERADAAEQALPLEAFSSGAWTLVDAFVRGDRYFVLARKSDRGSALVGLSKREQRIVEYAATGVANKVIAYELGVAPSTVATHLSAAARKLSLEARPGLLQVYAALVAEGNRARTGSSSSSG
jgi:DNA-binding NarL/FixJ family response regulator